MTEIQKKILFVTELSDAIVKVQGNVTSVDYEVYKNDNYGVREFLVIRYKGGAISARNCSGNSYSAIFREISDKLDHGYYSEVDYYNEIVHSYYRIYE